MIHSKSWSGRLADGGIFLVLTGTALLSLYPIWYMVAVSFSSSTAAASGIVKFWPVGFTLKSYQAILNDPAFFTAFGVSVKRVAIGAGLSFLLTVLTAYPLSKEPGRFRGRNVYMWFVIFTMLFSGGLIPWYLTIKAYGLLNSIWALVLPGAVPVFNVILVVNFFRNLPKELEEAGMMDGAGPWYLLSKVYVPLATPVLATVTLFSIVGHWNAYFDGLILISDPAKYPLQTYIQQLVVQVNTQNLTADQLKSLSELSDRTLNAAKIFVTMLPVLIVYPFLQRFFIHGIMLGSVKE
ncbi:carbohydrate ABC transporter permease [Cohnella nanjingensis]|uniref:Carbohydrate ABC transporter permease n=1 Tax=Cohnella nanjingensis TaxID=1387779 RepID=A0A7X0RRU1_9BACL|nr:carbohydrate ABC transporter permease [Cohnella nanjingensis]MBB6672522.1 carbohydrate ABC transporter permease [Cohnella nanjingensis]